MGTKKPTGKSHRQKQFTNKNAFDLIIRKTMSSILKFFSYSYKAAIYPHILTRVKRQLLMDERVSHI